MRVIPVGAQRHISFTVVTNIYSIASQSPPPLPHFLKSQINLKVLCFILFLSYMHPWLWNDQRISSLTGKLLIFTNNRCIGILRFGLEIDVWTYTLLGSGLVVKGYMIPFGLEIDVWTYTLLGSVLVVKGYMIPYINVKMSYPFSQFYGIYFANIRKLGLK